MILNLDHCCIREPSTRARDGQRISSMHDHAHTEGQEDGEQNKRRERVREGESKRGREQVLEGDITRIKEFLGLC